MIPFIPDHIVCTYTTTPVPRFTGGRDHELVLGGLICTATRANEGSNEFKSKSTGLWQVKPRLFPEVPYAFAPQQMFCFQGKLFWADFVKFDFISLPRGYLVRGLTDHWLHYICSCPDAGRRPLPLLAPGEEGEGV
jgi:hypothetical protein